MACWLVGWRNIQWRETIKCVIDCEMISFISPRTEATAHRSRCQLFPINEIGLLFFGHRECSSQSLWWCWIHDVCTSTILAQMTKRLQLSVHPYCSADRFTHWFAGIFFFSFFFVVAFFRHSQRKRIEIEIVEIGWMLLHFSNRWISIWFDLVRLFVSIFDYGAWWTSNARP